jgi:hypothetical protein
LRPRRKAWALGTEPAGCGHAARYGLKAAGLEVGQ